MTEKTQKSPGQQLWEALLQNQSGTRSAEFQSWHHERDKPMFEMSAEAVRKPLLAEIEKLKSEVAVGHSTTLHHMKRLFNELSYEDRLAWLNENFPCCRYCGSLDPRCQCWNDE